MLTGQDELRLELRRLQEELERERRQAAESQRQLERYAADLRETFKRERERRHELRRSYMATVRALCNAVEARDAYTGKHAERVAAYGMAIARMLDAPFARSPTPSRRATPTPASTPSGWPRTASS